MCEWQLELCVFFCASRMLREQWIRAKYERNEFEFIEKQEPYSAGTDVFVCITILVKTLVQADFFQGEADFSYRL